MHESGHSERPSRRELRVALERVEAAHARHDRGMREAIRAGEVVPQQVQRNVEMLREEVARLRGLLAD